MVFCSSVVSNKCASFDEACRRAAGRRAYNKRRRLRRAARISAILALQEHVRLTGRELAARFDVHEATVSRDLKFIRQVRVEFRRISGESLSPRSFSWLRGALGWQITFEMRDGFRVL